MPPSNTMAWVNLVGLLALLQFLFFIYLVGRARGRYGIRAPATTGHDVFERYFRVQQNTLECIVMFLPALWLAALYFNPAWIAAIGAVYVIGRGIYCLSYVRDPRTRGLGYLLTMAPVLILMAAAAFGALRAVL